MKKSLISVLTLFLLIIFSCTDNNGVPEVRLRLKWVKQAQFAGYLVAEAKGFYSREGLNVEILPAGPDIKSFITVANGSDQFGIAMPNQIIQARSNGVPLTIIAQIMQNSPYRYVLKSKNKIDSLSELKGEKIGLWLKADEAEFIAMLEKEGLSLNDFDVIPQEYSVIPFLEDKYQLSAVTVYNELNQIRNQGYEGDSLQILSPKDYDCAFLGDMIFANQNYLESNPDVAKKFLSASIEGWIYTLENPEEALDIVLAANPELERNQQKQQLEAVISLIKFGPTLTNGLGYIPSGEYEKIKNILLNSGQLDNQIEIKSIFDESYWSKVADEVKSVSN